MNLQLGIDKILANGPAWKNKRIGLLTNDAAKTSNGIPTRQALMNGGFQLVQLFSPEHGIDALGADGAKMNDKKDELTGLNIISLYGEKMMPNEKDLVGIEVLLFDIPDAGTRFYTYLWTMTYLMQAAAKYKIKMVVLDRPNPLSGDFELAEGPFLDASVSSFIGRFDIPIKHQCTIGELARYFNSTESINADLEIITCDHLKRKQFVFDEGLPWVNPSPALQNKEACLLYPGLCFFEATNVSVGRGTKYSFEWIGATWFNMPAITMVWQNLLRDEIKIESLPIQNGDDKIDLNGIRIKIIDPSQYKSVMNGLLLLKLIKDIHPQDFSWQPYPTQANPTGQNHLSMLLGIPMAEQLFDAPLQIWLQQITKLLRVTHWEKQIQPYLLYQ